MTATVMERFLKPERNVGASGGDYAARLAAALLFIMLLLMLVPAFSVPYSNFKIAALVSMEVGLVFLMMGLFLGQMTYFAGINLFFVPLAMLLLRGFGWSWVAFAFGAVFLIMGIQNLVTRRCGLNALLGIRSCGCQGEVRE
ncbi:MAG: hypothetical protein ACREL6_02500 [Gemmatimonadales bacterium]